jgi:hypothetical protein
MSRHQGTSMDASLRRKQIEEALGEDARANRKVWDNTFNFVRVSGMDDKPPTPLERRVAFELDGYLGRLKSTLASVASNFTPDNRGATNTATISAITESIAVYNRAVGYLKHYTNLGQLSNRDFQKIVEKFDEVLPLLDTLVNAISARQSDARVPPVPDEGAVVKMYKNLQDRNYQPVKYSLQSLPYNAQQIIAEAQERERGEPEFGEVEGNQSPPESPPESPRGQPPAPPPRNPANGDPLDPNDPMYAGQDPQEVLIRIGELMDHQRNAQQQQLPESSSESGSEAGEGESESESESESSDGGGGGEAQAVPAPAVPAPAPLPTPPTPVKEGTPFYRQSDFVADDIRKMKKGTVLSSGLYEYWLVKREQRWMLRYRRKAQSGEGKKRFSRPPIKIQPYPMPDNDERRDFFMNARTGYSHLKHQIHPDPDMSDDENDAEAEGWDNVYKDSMEQSMGKSKHQLDDDAENKVMSRSDSELKAGAKKTQIKKKLMKLLELQHKK